MAEVKVFGTVTSPYSRRVEIALKLKGVEYEFIEEDLANKSPLLLKYNPVHSKIPILLHDGKVIVESLVILEYIDETWDGPSILPTDPYERAMARFWAQFVDQKCGAAMRNAFLSSGEEKEKAKEELSGLLKILDGEVKGKKFFGGDSIGLVDITFVFLAYWLKIIGEQFGVTIFEQDTFPNLCKWIQDSTTCNIVKENLPPKDKIIDKINARIQASTASK